MILIVKISVKVTFVITLLSGLLNHLSHLLRSSVTFSEEWRPTQTTHQKLSGYVPKEKNISKISVPLASKKPSGEDSLKRLLITLYKNIL